MYKNKKVVVVLPAYNAAKTLEKTYREIPFDLVDEVILCDDHSRDNTAELARSLGIQHVIVHEKNKGYGGNQKSLYNKAIEIGGDIVIMLHPDYQYTPKLIPSMVNIIGDHWRRVVSGGAGFPYPGYGRLERRYADVQIHRQSLSHAGTKLVDTLQIIGVPHRLPGF